jgi:Ger(x)C family germination protein
MRRWMKGCVAALCGLLMAGCWDRVEVNDLAIVIAFSIDKEANGEYRLSVQVPLVSNLGGPNGGGGGTSGDKAYYVDSATGKTLREANSVLQARMSRQLFYAHHRVIVIGEELAREGLREVLDIVARFPENRLTAYLVLAKGKGIDTLQAQPSFERFSGEAMRELIKKETIPVSVKDMAQMLNTPGVDAYLPYVTTIHSHPKGKSKEIQIIGVAQFRGDRMVGVFHDEAARGLRWFRHQFTPFATQVALTEKENVSVQFDKGMAEIKPVIRQGRIRFSINVYASATVIENMTSADLSKAANMAALERKLSMHITESVKKTLAQMRQQWTDTIGLGLVLARKYPREWRSELRKHWNERLAQVDFRVQTKAEITNIGQTTEDITKEGHDE